VEFACGIAHLSKGESLPQVAPGIDAMTMREPIGVCAGITPFNFPAMVPMWMFPIAIACGNTFVLKPSEKTPLTAIKLVELLREAGVPAGVFNLVHGGREAVEAICTDPLIAAISFVGSSGVAKSVYELGSANGKRVQAAGGAKNALIVMPDAQPESTVRAILGSAYGCAGQRCMAGSLLMCVGNGSDEWTKRISDRISKFVVDDTSTNPQADMGPVIDAASRDRLLRRIANASNESCDIAHDGRNAIPEKSGFYLGPTLIDNVDHEHDLFRDELFGPVLSINQSETLDEVIHKLNTLPYGNGATIFTQSGAVARQFAREMPCGMLGINIGVPAPMALFSFSGWNHSFYGDLHVQGTEGIMFYTRQKVVLSRWDKAYVRQLGW
jgi:malonate-semialdehyde dehydrogenase (acetylating)/methylmalonate-semialdehyde dehydrogenase